MFHAIWLALMVVSVLAAFANGRTEIVVAGVLEHASRAVEISIGLLGIMSFWLGLMGIAEQSGLVDKMVKAMHKLLTPLFAEVPSDHPAIGLMGLSMVSNMLGLNNATTPISVKAMRALQSLNSHPNTASHAMCLFVAINASSIQLFPTTAIAALAKGGATSASKIIVTGFLATTVSTVVAVGSALWFQRGVQKKTKETLTPRNATESQTS